MRNQHFPLGKDTFFQCKFYTFTNDKTAILKQDICMNQIKEALGTRSINQTELANRHGMTLICVCLEQSTASYSCFVSDCRYSECGCQRFAHIKSNQ